ncbi:MAG: ISL3 family transposase, partial [Rhodopila sp.]|nr:ISL3 family transposase [Rhodopila sp.]
PEPAAAAMVMPRDPFSGARISPVVAAALCIKPSGMLTRHQAGRVKVLKNECAGFAGMRALAMRLRGMIRGRSDAKLDGWLRDAMDSGIGLN